MITISGSQDLDDPNKRISLVLRIAHELLHQRVAEILKVDDPNGLGIEDKLQHRILKQMNDFDKASQISVSGANASFLQKSINEGCAVYGELKILKGMLSDSSITSEERIAVGEWIKERKSYLAESKTDERSTYAIGYNLVLELLSFSKDATLLELLNRINWEACGKVAVGSSEYRKIIADPTTIPGILN